MLVDLTMNTRKTILFSLSLKAQFTEIQALTGLRFKTYTFLQMRWNEQCLLVIIFM